MLIPVSPFECDACSGRGFVWLVPVDEPKNKETLNCNKCRASGVMWLPSDPAIRAAKLASEEK